jgi:hypothetical protein
MVVKYKKKRTSKKIISCKSSQHKIVISSIRTSVDASVGKAWLTGRTGMLIVLQLSAFDASSLLWHYPVSSREYIWNYRRIA